MPIQIGDLTLYSVEELSLLLGVSDNTIRRYFRDGILKGKKLGRRWYATETAIQDYFRGNGQAAPGTGVSP